MDAVPSYWELSPSGTGLRGICRAILPSGRRRTGLPQYGPDQGFEIYSEGRYITVTGHILGGLFEIVNCQPEIEALYARIFPAEKPPTFRPSPSGAALVLDDADLLERAMNAANGDNFRRLWPGDTGEHASHSEADLALCSMLVFWTRGDPNRVDRLFRQSRLYREKWDRPDYRERTITRALEWVTWSYPPGCSRKVETVSVYL
jgi:primase-polymerase (primpol)-like protein